MEKLNKLLRSMLLCSLLFSVVSADVYAQAQDAEFVHLTRRDGLSDVYAWPIAQDREGFMWIGSNAGLQRYDGYNVTPYRHDSRDSTSLRHNQVRSLLVDAGGTLWIGTSTGVDRMDTTTGRITHVELDPVVAADSARLLATYALHQEEDGTLWVGTANGLYALGNPDGLGSPVGEDVRHYMPEASDPTAPLARINDIAEGEGGVFWFGTQGSGLVRFDPPPGSGRTSSGGAFTSYRHDPTDPNSLSSDNVWDVHVAQDGTLWLGTLDGGLCRFEPGPEAFTCFRHDPAGSGGISDGTVQDIYEDEAGRLWLGTGLGGVSILDPETETFTYLRHDPDDPSSLGEDDVHTIFRDRFGTLWFAHHARGVSRMTPSQVQFTTHLADPSQPATAPVNIVSTVIEDRDSTLWIATERGLVHRDPATGAVEHHLPEPNVPHMTDFRRNPNLLADMVEDGQGLLWIGSPTGKLRIFDRTQREFRTVPTPEASKWVFPGAIDRTGAIWVGTEGAGLWRVDPGTETVTAYQPNPEQAGAQPFVDAAGTVWVVSSPGDYIDAPGPPTSVTIQRYDRERDAFEAVPNPLPAGTEYSGAFSPAEEPGVFWVSTSAGLYHVDFQTGDIQLYPPTESDLPLDLSAMQHDDRGRLWFGSSRGEFGVFDPGTGGVTQYYAEQGVQISHFFPGRRIGDGELLFNGFRGYLRFDPGDLLRNASTPAVLVTEVRAGNTAVQRSGNEPIKLSHDRNSLFFDYVGLHYADPARNTYRYTLEGFEDGWNDVGTQRTALYSRVPPGDYTFRVRAASADGVWNDEGAAVSFTIRPPWWRTLWAYGLYGFLFLGGVFAVDRVQRRRVISRERERTRERELAQAREIERAYTELKAAQAQLVQQEKLASLGALTAGIAHEIKNPLNFVNNFAELNCELVDELLEDLAGHPAALLLADVKMNSAKIEEHGKRADGIVRSMLEHSRGTKGDRRAVDLNGFVEEYVNLAYHGKRAQVPGFNVEIVRDYDEAVGKVELVPQEMGRVLINLLSNAFDAVHERATGTNGQADGTRAPALDGYAPTAEGYAPTVTVSTRRKGNKIEIRVADNGTGIPADVRERVFEPFFTTKPSGAGTGLGLSMSYDIVTTGHGGSLSVESAGGEGSVFTIAIPNHLTPKAEAVTQP